MIDVRFRFFGFKLPLLDGREEEERGRGMDEGSVKAKLLEKAAAHRKEVKRTAAYVVTTAGFHSSVFFFCTTFVLMLLIVLMFANAMVKKERGREKRY